MSWLEFLAVILIILGALGYIEQLCGFKWPRRTSVILLGAYLLFSFGQWYMNNREQSQTQQAGEQLRTNLRDTQQQLAEQHKELADAQRKQVTAEQALRDVEAQQRPRTFSADQRRLLIQQLREGPKGRFEIILGTSDPEADYFGRQFDLVLKDAGWTRKESAYGSRYLDKDYQTEFLVGLMMDISRTDLAPHGESLRHALHTAGLDISIRIFPEIPETVVRLVVGHKPWP